MCDVMRGKSDAIEVHVVFLSHGIQSDVVVGMCHLGSLRPIFLTLDIIPIVPTTGNIPQSQRGVASLCVVVLSVPARMLSVPVITVWAGRVFLVSVMWLVR
jgi:hypothetical protein